MLMVVAILTSRWLYNFIKACNFNNGGTSKNYRFIPMLMVVTILIPNWQVAAQFRTVLLRLTILTMVAQARATDSFQC